MVSSGMKCIKYLLFLFNLVFFIAGLVLIIAGTLIQTRFDDDFKFFEGGPVNPVAMILIGVGLIIFTISFFGCCGAYKENKCMILTFSVLLGFVFMVEIGGGIAAHMTRTKIDRLIRDAMTHSSRSYPKGKAVKKAWDDVQQHMHCCGARNYTDWSDNPNLNLSVPDSCCMTWVNGCGKDALRHGISAEIYNVTAKIYTKGCADRFLEASDVTIIVVVCIAIAIAIAQIVGIVSACSLASNIRKDYDRV